MKWFLYSRNLAGYCIILMIILCGACSSDYLRYDVNQKDAIYMMFTADSVERTFDAYALKDSMSAGPEIHLMGFPRDYDREIEVELIDSLTTAQEGIHYWFDPKTVIKAGKLQTEIALVFYRRKDPELYKKRVCVAFKVKENEHFALVPGRIFPVFRVILTAAKVERPVWWSETYLGPYSETLHVAFLQQFLALEGTNPALYKTLENNLGYLFVYCHSPEAIWSSYKYPVIKNIVHPLYDYYLQHPDPEVKIPTPEY